MSDYQARANEVNAAIQEFVTWSKSAESDARAAGASAPTAVDPLGKTMTLQQAESADQERSQFQDKVKRYYDARNQTMQQLTAALELLDNSDDDLVAKWRQPCDSLTSTYASTLGTLLSGISNPTQNAVVLKTKIQSGEDSFVKSLAAFPVAERFARMRKKHRELLNGIASLRTRWDSCASKSREINQSALDLVGRLDSKYQAALRGTGSDWSSAVSAVHDVCDLLNAAASASNVSESSAQSAIDSASAGMDKTNSPLANVGNAWRDALSQFQSTLPALTSFQSAELDGVHKVFQDIRKEVAEYVRYSPADLAKFTIDYIENGFSQWISYVGDTSKSDAAKRDASDFRYDCLRKGDDCRDEVLKNWDTFERENKGKFYDTIASNWVNTLLFQDEWRAAKRFLVDQGNIESPRFAEAQLANFFSLPLEGAYNNLLAAVKEKVDESSREAIAARVELARDAALGQYDARTESIRATLSAVYDLVKTDDYRKLFDRPQLESSLRSS